MFLMLQVTLVLPLPSLEGIQDLHLLQDREDIPLHLQHLQDLAVGGGYRRG